MAKSYDELTFTDDFLFCKIMQDEKICKGVLELLLGIKIKKIDYVQKQKTIDESLMGHGIRLDVYAEGDDKIFDVEMQTSLKPDLGLRTRFYQSLIDMENLEKGQDYQKLRQSIIIFICLDDPFDKELPVYSFKTKCVEDNAVELNDKAEKYFYNAGKYMQCDNKHVRAFLEYLKKGKTAQSDLLKRISSAVERAKINERWRHEYMVWGLAYHDAQVAGRAAGLEDGRAEGLEIGRAEGIVEGRATGLVEGRAQGRAQAFNEAAVNALKLGIAPEVISEMLTIPLEKILELQKEIKQTDKR